MKIALCSSFMPFIRGGGRNIVDWLASTLIEAGHEVEVVYLPELDSPPDILFQQMMALRWVDLQAADRIICFRPQAHLIPHPHKILWFIHHIRTFYDLWDTPYRDFPDTANNRAIRESLIEVDSRAMAEAKTVFTNSKVVSDRLRKFNDVDSQVLYPPVYKPERFFNSGYNDEIVCICRLEHYKRQHLLIEALSHTTTPVRLRIMGVGASPEYATTLRNRSEALNVADRVILEDRWITEEEKVLHLSQCLAAAYLPLDEDSYGYPSLEASHSQKPVLTTRDSGGVLELVQDGYNGYVAEPTPESLACAMDKLYQNKKTTEAMGTNAKQRLVELKISWSQVLERLLA
ncbi:glycosyl transferase family 1 [Pseudomonas moraviensis]|uniref:Glycosyl transferase family 1 n=1 Tax=Pseudomonas moraviensis TaxID=321662 RepID=A0A423NPP2_9PSED|nr:glycosyltransferase family 4 protein [Pseudomonas moraviensis]ROO00258.1 glycosyl transferase family 1 [Pseudomonas moraviensis]